MALNCTDIESILGEIQAVVIGGWIQKIHQPQDLSITLEVRSPGTSIILYLCVDSQWARLHLISKKYSNPSTPPPFCQFLRAHLEGGCIEEITQQPNDRLVYFTIRKVKTIYQLVIALIGNRTNILLLDKESRLLTSLKPSRCKVGEKFIPPTTSSPLSENRVSLWSTRANPQFPATNNTFAAIYPISASLETSYDHKERQDSAQKLQDQQLAHAKKSLKAAKRKFHALQEDFKKAERYREYGRYGELMKSNLHELQKGQPTATLIDYFDPALPTLTLPLDPAKDPVRNMEDYFRKYQKYLGAQEHLIPRLTKQEQQIEKLEQQLIQIAQGNIISAFSSKASATPKKNFVRASHPQKVHSAPAQGYRTYTSADGISILVGKTAKDNDHLTFKVGKPDDLWLHARGTPGSHVIVKLEKGKTIPHDTLKDAATLSLWFSDLRKSGKGEVIYTLRKFVKKAKGQKPGAVHVTRDKSLWIEIQKNRLHRLKGDT